MSLCARGSVRHRRCGLTGYAPAHKCRYVRRTWGTSFLFFGDDALTEIRWLDSNHRGGNWGCDNAVHGVGVDFRAVGVLA